MRGSGLLAIAIGVSAVACSGDDGSGESVEPISDTLEETIEFESLTFPGQWLDPFMPPMSAGEPSLISGRLLVPPTDEPLPVVVLVHGCGGVSGASLGWTRELEAVGIASFLVDSFSERDIRSVCTGAEGINQATLLVDMYRALDELDEHPYVDTSRVAIMGFSMGGRTALWSAMARFQERYGGRPLDGYLAFYPLGCYIELERETDVAGGPVRIFHGEADDWLPIRQCEEYVGRLEDGGVDIALFSYADALHAFDDRGIPSPMALPGALNPGDCSVVERDGALVETSVGGAATVESSCVQRGGSIGHHPEARDRAVVDVMSVLDEVLAN